MAWGQEHKAKRWNGATRDLQQNYLRLSSDHPLYNKVKGQQQEGVKHYIEYD